MYPEVPPNAQPNAPPYVHPVQMNITPVDNNLLNPNQFMYPPVNTVNQGQSEMKNYVKDVVHKEMKSFVKEFKKSQKNSKNEFSIATTTDIRELHDFGTYLGINLNKYPELIPIVIQAMNEPLPEGWSKLYNTDGGMYYYSQKLKRSEYEHPMDSYYRRVLESEKQKYKSKSCTIL